VGSVKFKMDEYTFKSSRERAIDNLNTHDLVYVFDSSLEYVHVVTELSSDF